MGMHVLGSGCSVYDKETEVYAPNPNPINFKLIEAIQVENNIVAEIEYPDCENFEGVKICVYKNLTKKELEEAKEIDPHFSLNGFSPFARFEPTQEGKIQALLLAQRLI